MFKNLLNNSPRRVGLYTGSDASNYLKSLGKTEFSFKQFRPMPTQTAYFNTKQGRYIYTKKGGWIDMAHFMFYAGKAYEYKQIKEDAISIVNSDSFLHMRYGREIIINQATMDPVGEAIQDGYLQERSDSFVAPHSAYSYEDLPSDKYGADFGANFFDPNSKLTFGEQIENYLINRLGATDPISAPNYRSLPESDSSDQPPTRTNHTTTPVYVEENP